MPLIQLTTFIEAPQERVFDLSLSVDLHQLSMNRHNERIIGGKGSGVMALGEEVTWSARHLLKERKLKVKVTQLQRPHFFRDEQVEGDFRKMRHEHYFKPADNGTLMIDQFYYETPYGVLGRLVNQFYLEKYLTGLLHQRNEVIRKVAEGGQWQQFLK